MSAPIRRWVPGPLTTDVERSLERTSRAAGVMAVAVMPDVHLAHDVCVGTVVATEGVLYPAAIGGDVGCGVTTLRFNGEASQVRRKAGLVLDRLGSLVPVLRHRVPQRLPAILDVNGVPRILRGSALRDGRLQFGTVGRGNHFVELQSDHDGRLWMTVHSGSRAVAPSLQSRYRSSDGGLVAVADNSEEAKDFLAAHDWAVAYAEANREEIAARVASILHSLFGMEPEIDSMVTCNHNLVRREDVGGRVLWVHRKGAIPAHVGVPGVIPGSMGSPTFLVKGRGCVAALNSSSHGAGRALSRTEARQRFSERELRRQTAGVALNEKVVGRLVEEAPGAYKDINVVMRAQRELTKVVGRLEPVLNYKGV